MKVLKNGLMCIVACTGFFAACTDACTTFCITQDQQRVFGRNYDWPIEDGLVMVNKRQVNKVAAVLKGGTPAKWVSRYGSVTFNQYGRELPNGGINEKGLVVEVMWLDKAVYPQPDSRPAINTLSWIQYQLDTAGSVAEVIASDAQIRITPEFGPKLHYFVCEQKGACATIEFIGGTMVVHTADSLPLTVLSNNTYEDSIKNFSEPDKTAAMAASGHARDQSLNRFSRAAKMVQAYQEKPSKPAVDYAFDVLAEVAQSGSTKWSIVYDLQARQVYFRTHSNPAIRSVNLSALDFSCKTPMKILSLKAAGAGDMRADFTDYTVQANRSLIETAFRETGMTKDIPAAVLDRLAANPEQFTCN